MPIAKGDYFVLSGTGARSLRVADQFIIDYAVSATESLVRQFKGHYGDRLRIASGMAEGFDELLACTATQLEVPFWAIIPTKTYGSYYWGQNSRTQTNRLELFNRFLDLAEEVEYVEKNMYRKGRHANFWRNDRLVQLADHMLVWDPSSRGTSECLATIKKVKRPHTIIRDPILEDRNKDF